MIWIALITAVVFAYGLGFHRGVAAGSNAQREQDQAAIDIAEKQRAWREKHSTPWTEIRQERG